MLKIEENIFSFFKNLSILKQNFGDIVFKTEKPIKLSDF